MVASGQLLPSEWLESYMGRRRWRCPCKSGSSSVRFMAVDVWSSKQSICKDHLRSSQRYYRWQRCNNRYRISKRSNRKLYHMYTWSNRNRPFWDRLRRWKDCCGRQQESNCIPSEKIRKRIKWYNVYDGTCKTDSGKFFRSRRTVRHRNIWEHRWMGSTAHNCYGRFCKTHHRRNTVISSWSRRNQWSKPCKCDTSVKLVRKRSRTSCRRRCISCWIK